MAALEAALEAVRQGSPATLLIGGEAGVGKSRLVGEFSSRARACGARVVTGGCLELGADGLPFAPFTAMLRDLVRELGPDQVNALLPGGGRVARELARLLPELTWSGASPGTGRGLASRGLADRELANGGLTSGDPASAGPADTVSTARLASSADSAGEARARLFEEFLTLLERLAELAPLVVVVEDAHWADGSSRDLLAFLTGYQRTLRQVLIVVTFRSDELHRTHPLRPLLAELGRIDWVERIELPRLSPAEAVELATGILDHPPAPELADRLFQRAEGNPLFTEELLCCDGGLAEEIPDSLADLLLNVVRRLPEETQEVLRVASAASGGASHALLVKVTGRGEADLSRALRPAVTGNVLITTSGGYAFRHALIREAVHEDLLPGEHGQVHARYAEAIDADPALVPDGRAEIEKAHHWHAAHDTTWALIAAWQAAAQPGHAVAYAERLMLLSRVLELWDQVADAAGRIGADHVRVLEEAVEAAQDAGDDQRGMALATSAIGELDQDKDPIRLAELLGKRSLFQDNLGLPGAVQDIERALQLLPETTAVPGEASSSPGATAMRVRVRLLLDQAGCEQDRAGQRYQQWTTDALRFAREAGDLVAESRALLMLAMAKASPTGIAAPGSEPLLLLEQAREVAQRAGVYQPFLKAVTGESHFLCGIGEYQRAADVARRGIADAERYGLAKTAGTFLAINVVEPLIALGRWDEGNAVAEQALDLLPSPRTRAGLWVIMSGIDVARGNLDAATRRLSASRRVFFSLRYEDQFHLAQENLDIALPLASGDLVAALDAASAAVSQSELPASGPRYVWPLLVTALDAAVTAISSGDQANAAAGGVLAEQLHSIAGKVEAFGPVQQAYQLMFMAGDPLADAGDLPGGSRLAVWEAAASAWEALGQPYLTAITLTGGAREALRMPEALQAPDSGPAGETRWSADDRAGRAGAVRRLRQAARLAADLAAQPLSDQVAALAHRAGISLDDAAGSRAGSAADGARRSRTTGTPAVTLTSREQEVLRLVAAGRTNREIAATLFISPKTASV
ncbi:MAG TPA: AAA family ATPase, partial [Trebonia sp.]|nr:AAA family ATPase [Trebonia sp.]